ncbi:hypothetical protein BGW38_007658, partial [Lunasporangiospora selenospora]
PPTDDFSIGNAELIYDSVNQLTDSRVIQSSVGVDTLELSFGNGLVITGKLDM